MRRGGKGASNYVTVDDVQFRAPATHIRSVARPLVAIIYAVILGAWSVLASWPSHPWLGVLSALVYLELGLAAVRSLQLAGVPILDRATAERIVAPLRELCALAACQVPRVSVMSRATRGALVRDGPGRAPQLVVAQPLLDRLDDLELRAILAHEVSHLVAGDLERLRLMRWALAAVGGVSCFIAVILTAGDDVAIPIFIAWVFVGLIVIGVLLSLLQRRPELRADAGAVRLTKDPEHLVSALEKAVALSQELRRQVLAGPWRWLLALLAWKVPSHPKVQVRAALIRGLAASGKTGPS